MPWGPRAGAPGNSNKFMASGNGRDTFILSSPEFQYGRVRAQTQRFAYQADGRHVRHRPSSGPNPPSEKRLEEFHRGVRSPPGRTRPLSTTELLMRRAGSAPYLMPMTGASGTRSEETQARLPSVRERPLFGVNSGVCFFSDPMSTADLHGSCGATIAGPGTF
mmetsp:Transcript_32762/g.76182  ORF Transcript_32762/g.76182 Transcript_32762/m.76182 type:complete len:163 (-) Transcript_32762:46-534(-)